MSEMNYWYEWDGKPAGPVPPAAILDLVRKGALGPSARVWRSGLSQWIRLSEVPELAAALPSPTVPLPAGPTGGGPPPPFAATERGRAGARPDPVSPGATVALGVVTLGIYPMVKFYQAALVYEGMALRRSHFVIFFWLAVGLFLVGFPLHIIPFGFVPAHLAALVFTVLTLFEVLEVRGEAVKRLRSSPPLASPGTHQALFIASLLTFWIFIGFVLIAVETYKFFKDHEAIVAAAAAPA